jgi:hypothetical protein
MLRLAACARLKDELLREGIGVAMPIGYRELDLLASVGSSDHVRPSAWIPIKVVAVHADELNASLENLKASGLVIALVCERGTPDAIRAYAFTPAELIIANMIALTQRQRDLRPGKRDDAAPHTRDGTCGCD